MVSKQPAQNTQLVFMRPNGIAKDLNQREIAAKDVSFNGQFGNRSEYGIVPHVAITVQQYARGRMCVLNSAYMWFECED